MASPGATARYFDLHPVEFLEGMSDLDDEVQVAVYCIVIMLIYARRGPVANDAKWIAGLAKVRYRTTCRKALDALVAKGKLFVDDDGKLMNRRAAKVLSLTTDRIQKARTNGRLGGRPQHRESTGRASGGGREVAARQTRFVENQGFSKPRPFQPSTINHHNSSTTTNTDPAREAEPSPSAQPARATKPTTGPGIDQPADPATVEAAIRELGVDPAEVPAPAPPAKPRAASVARPSTQQQLEALAAQARERLMRRGQ
jgi:hypothetical protein